VGAQQDPYSLQNQAAQLTDVRTTRPDAAVWSYSSQQATLRRLNKAFDAFFRRVKTGRKPGFPRFKGRHRFDSVEWPKDGDGARWHPETNSVYLQGIGSVKVTAHRGVRGTCEDDPNPPRGPALDSDPVLR
jgi:putative transposase